MDYGHCIGYLSCMKNYVRPQQTLKEPRNTPDIVGNDIYYFVSNFVREEKIMHCIDYRLVMCLQIREL